METPNLKGCYMSSENHSLMDENIVVFAIGDVDKWNR
jgi:hypothetical protein